MRRYFTGLSVVALALVLAACAPSNNNKKIPVGEEIALGRRTFSFDQEKAPYDLFKDYRIQAGDVLDVLFQIRTWVEKENFVLTVDHTLEVRFIHAPELNQLQRIRPDGTVSMPYLGVVHVVGRRVDDLAEELQERYSTILRNPDLYIIVPEFRSAIKELKADLHTAPRGLSRLVTVRPDGYVTFPMVGNTFVAGKTIPEVNEQLNSRYEEILPGLHCDLFLEKHSGSVVYVVGEVQLPGSYPIAKPISVIEAITLAGSFAPSAELDSVMVVRKNGESLVATRLSLQDSLDFTTESSFFYLQPDDIVLVPKTHLARSAEIANHLRNIIFFRGWGINIEPKDFD